MSNTTSRAVVLLHGLGDAPQASAGLELGLRQHGFCVVTPSLEGLRDRTQPWFRRWISDSLTEVDRQAVAHGEVNLCGIKHGASLALAVAAERPTKLDSLALISPRLSILDWTTSRARLRMSLPEWLTDWRLPLRNPSKSDRAEDEGITSHARAGRQDDQLLTNGPATSPAQRREARRLIHHVEGLLGRVNTPTLIVYAGEDTAAAHDVRYVQVHIGSQFIETLLESRKHLIMDDVAFEGTVLKIVEFFNDVARRRALAAPNRSC